MTRALRIITAGPHASVQDRGRPGQQWLGIPEGGALDRVALSLGNALVGNPLDAAAIEVCMGNIAIELLAPARVALTGTSEAVLSVQDSTGYSMTVEANRSVDLDAGRQIRLAAMPDSNTAILAFSGGIDTPPVMSSRSTSVSATIGWRNGRLLQDGDTLPLGEIEALAEPEWIMDDPVDGDRAVIRCVRGPQDERFTDAALATFFSDEFKVSPTLSRMGMRLEGPVLEHVTNADIPSDGIVTGTIQVPGNGQPIVLLADHQSTGGYTKVATVISADFPKLARLRPGEGLVFAEVSVVEAEAIARERQRRLDAAIARRRPAPPVMDMAALYGLGDTT